MDALGKIQHEVAQLKTEEPLCPHSLGLSSYKPAKSCRDIFCCDPSPPSGYYNYWLKSASIECREVYCDMHGHYPLQHQGRVDESGVPQHD